MTDQPVQTDITETEKWLYLLHGDCPGFSVISSTLDWTGKAFRVGDDAWPGNALDYVNELGERGAKGIYLRVTPVPTSPKRYSRGRAADAIALPGLWADMDIAGPGHKERPVNEDEPPPLPLPDDEELCYKILYHSGLPQPTLWIHSGGGLYPWWMFTQPELLDTDTVEFWGELSRQFHEIIGAAAADLGYRYGTESHDMARVLRLPGTLNRKVADDVKLAHFYDESGDTFEAEALVELIHELHAEWHPIIPTPIPTPSASTRSTSPSSYTYGADEVMPGTDYNERGDVLYDVLLPAGWQVHSRLGQELRLTRPGKNRRDGHSATLGHEGSNNLYVFSGDAGLPTNTPLSPHYLYAHYRCGGDFKAATKELAGKGYGTPLKPRSPTMATPTPSVTPEPSTPRYDEPAGEEDTASPAPSTPHTPVAPVPPSTPANHYGPALVGPEALNLSAQGLPYIDLSYERDTIAAVSSHVGWGPTECLFYHQGEIVYVQCMDPMMNTPGVKDVPIARMTASNFRSMLSIRFQVIKKNKDGEYVPCMIPQVTATTIFSNPMAMNNLRRLEGISRTPIIRSDGTIWDTPGYDPITEYIYNPGPDLVIPKVSEDPSPTEIASARGVIDQMLVDFPFITSNDKLNYIGMMITPLLFNMISTPIKMGIIGAHQPGSGKTLLATLIQLIHGGTLMPGLRHGSDEEIRKAITSNLRWGTEPVSVWDNVAGRLDSPILDALLTTRRWRDRVLGKSEMIDLDNNRLWLVTGNNINVGSDLTRRTLWSMIDPNMPNPEHREGFTIPDLTSWVLDNKGRILHALYTIIQAWAKAGRPAYCPRSDLFCKWSGTVAGMLSVAGWEGEFDAESSRQAASEEATSVEWSDLFDEIIAQFGEGEEWMVGDVLDRMATTHLANPMKPIPLDVLPPDLIKDFSGGQNTLVARTIGLRFASIQGRYINGVKIVRNPRRTSRGYRWSLHRYVAPGPVGTAPAPRDHAEPSRPGRPRTAQSASPSRTYMPAETQTVSSAASASRRRPPLPLPEEFEEDPPG